MGVWGQILWQCRLTCSLSCCVQSLGALTGAHPYATESLDSCVLLSSWIIHVPEPLLISVEAAASLHYGSTVMWLYGDQSSLYPAFPKFFTTCLRVCGIPSFFYLPLHKLSFCLSSFPPTWQFSHSFHSFFHPKHNTFLLSPFDHVTFFYILTPVTIHPGKTWPAIRVQMCFKCTSSPWI